MKTLIVGGGATGLTVAYLLSRAGQEVEVYEAAGQAGGLMNTFDVGDGVRLEYFYHHFFTHDAEINWLISELGLESDVRFIDSTMGIYRDGRLFEFNGVKDLLKFNAMGLWGRFRFGLTSAMLAYFKSYTKREDKTALEWFYAKAGRDATDAIWRPMLEVKFGEAADKIPLAWIAGRLRQRVLSRKSGVEKLGYLNGSLQRLTDSLVTKVEEQGVVLNLNKPVKRIPETSGDSVSIELADGTVAKGDRLVFTIPTNHLAGLMRHTVPGYASELDSIEYLGAICTVLSFPQALSDTYWTNIADGNCDFGGVIEQTNLVPSECYGGQHLVYLSKYALPNDPIWDYEDEKLIDRQLGQLERIYKRPLKDSLKRAWVFRSRTAAPVTDMGFKDRVPPFKTPLSNVYMASMCHLYPEERSVNNSIRVAAELLRDMGEREIADSVPKGISTAGEIGRTPGFEIARAA